LVEISRCSLHRAYIVRSVKVGTTPNPDALEFYTYRYFANNRTFYVGKGHWVSGQKTQRVNDRGIFASRLRRNLLERHIEHKDCKKKDIQVLNLLHFRHKLKVRWEFLG
jgi:hypothetical protein